MDLGTAVAGAWSSGISMYAVAAILGIGGRLDWVDSPDFLQRPWVIVAALVLFAIEFVVDKVSYVDSTWDAVHTVPPPGRRCVPARRQRLLQRAPFRSPCRVLRSRSSRTVPRPRHVSS